MAMKIPKYWGKGEAKRVDDRGREVAMTCWGWSESGVDEARLKARVRAEELLGRRMGGEELNRYSYGTRPMREEIVEAVTDGRGRELGVVTRNGYGALVLNAVGVMFIDLDFGRDPDARPGILARLFGGKSNKVEAKRLAEVEAWAERHRELDVRVYRTRKGLRAVVTNEVFEPAQAGAEELMRELRSDPLYVKLCRQQECFRARLTPKPWRIRVGRPPVRYPFESAAQEQRAREWERGYESASGGYTVCREVARIGSGKMHPEVERILKVHDQYCCRGEGLKLA
jgi:hypothetical protein